MLQKYIEKSGTLKDVGGKSNGQAARISLDEDSTCFDKVTSVTLYMDNPKLRPSICSVFICIPITLCGIILLGLYSAYGSPYCTVGLLLFIGGLLSTLISLGCYVRKRNHAVQLQAEKLTEKESTSVLTINPNMHKVEDPIMARSIILPKFRACEEAWVGVNRPKNENRVKGVRFYTPLRRDHMISHSEQLG